MILVCSRSANLTASFHSPSYISSTLTSPRCIICFSPSDGGPGCSSTTGLLFELGPCLISANGTETVYNPYSWNEVSNMIFLDQPVNVGFSYTEGKQVLTTPDAAVDVYAFLQLFMKSFPDWSHQEFNIAGESYGGHYIPNFASYIHERKVKVEAGDEALTVQAKETHLPINLKSILIGNGLTEPFTQFASVPEYACAPSEHAFLDESSCTSMRTKVPTCQRLQSYCYDSPSRFTCECLLCLFRPRQHELMRCYLSNRFTCCFIVSYSNRADIL